MPKGFATKVVALAAILTLGLSAQAATKRYLVQFKSPQAFASAAQSVAALTGQLQTEAVAPRAATLFGTSARVTHTLNTLHMMVVESDDALVIASLRSHPEVARVEAEIMHPAPAPIATRGDSRRLGDNGDVVNGPGMPWGISAVKAPAAWNTTRGEGARVMVLDTGVDQTHEALQGQIEAVQNFSGGDPTDVTDNVGHGTHVSGTILANGKANLIGVAPGAKLLMGKVCTAEGCSSIAIAEGLDWAAQEKVDVVNMSLGGMFMSAGESQALDDAEAAGVTVVAASGNDGQPSVSFPAASATAFAVGAIDINMAKASFSNWGPELAVVAPGVDVISSVPKGTGRGSSVQIDLADGRGLQTVKSSPFVGSPISAVAANSLVFANLGKTEDFSSIDVKGKFALIQRGDNTFKEKVTNAITAGAVGVVIFNNEPGMMQGTITDDGSQAAIPAVLVEQSTGQALQAALAAGKVAQASMGVVGTDFANYQGTSMATPHVAGVAALVRAANKTLTPAQVRDLLKSTATPLTPNDQNQMGAGLVNAEAAVAKALTAVVPQFRVAN